MMKRQAPMDGIDPTARVRRAGGLVTTVSAMALFTLAVAACSDATGPTTTQQGILRFEAVGAAPSEGPSDVTDGSVEAPAQVRVGQSFTATVTTVGLDGCWQPVGEEVSVDDLTASIVPLDRDRGGEDIACTQALTSLEHSVTLSFEQAGEAVLRVEGRRVVGRDQRESEPHRLETTVSVVP